MWPSHTGYNPYEEPGHVGSWGSCKAGLQEVVRWSHAAVLWYPSGFRPGSSWSGCTHAVGSQGRTPGQVPGSWDVSPAVEGEGSQPFVLKSPTLPEWCWCASVSRGWAWAVGKNRGLGCQLSSPHLPWTLGVALGALTLVEKAGLTISCSSCPLEEGFCLLLSDSHADACLLRPQHWSATELAVCLALTA